MALGKPTRVVEDNCGVHQATVLIRLRASWRKKTLRGLSMEKLNPQVRRPLFLHQNWRFAMAKPWICANYADGKNSAGMFIYVECLHIYLYVDVFFYIYIWLYSYTYIYIDTVYCVQECETVGSFFPARRTFVPQCSPSDAAKRKLYC